MARFEYHVAASAAEALDLLARYDGEAKLLAGGQSLMPLINMRLARPAALVDLNRLGELAYIRETDGREDDGVVAIGALTRDAAVGRSEIVQRRLPLLAEATSYVGYPAIRNRATLGGSIAHGDPGGEYPTVAVALGAEIALRGARGVRTVPAEAFFLGPLTTALEENELLTEVRFPAQPPGQGWAYEELTPRPGDYAVVGVVALLQLGADGRCVEARLAYTNVGPTPLRARHAEETLTGQVPDATLLDLASAMAAEEVEPESDALASADYKRQMTRVFTRRALTRALGRIGKEPTDG